METSLPLRLMGDSFETNKFQSNPCSITRIELKKNGSERLDRRLRWTSFHNQALWFPVFSQLSQPQGLWPRGCRYISECRYRVAR